MCTVSFIPSGNKIFLTSNRDEQVTRAAAVPPLVHRVGDTSILFPKDGAKGGTWIAVNRRGDTGVLLNGAAQAHNWAGPYRYSRGFILTQLLSDREPVAAFSALDTRGVEPFTLILFVRQRLYECRWDGQLRSMVQLPADRPHLWSSSTLYDASAQAARKAWFRDWVHQHPAPGAADVLQLHRQGGAGDPWDAFVMNRNDQVRTVSITSIEWTRSGAAMTYHRLSDQGRYRNDLSFSWLDIPGRLSTPWRKLLVRLRHWEYWPFPVVYAPIFPFWFWLCFKARSLFFFTASNPTIRNGGFLMESKKEIYELMPRGSYPRTLFVRPEATEEVALAEMLMQHGLSFPLVAKPDIGLRGLGVQLLQNGEELLDYHQQSQVDYLLQAYVPYANEVGIFYCRIPGQKSGQITGIVGKELLMVEGDGVRTVEERMCLDGRFLLQLDSLRRKDPVLLTQVLKAGEQKLLVPYGNHSRGARFVDWSHLADARLVAVIDRLCVQIPGFYFGRLDIRYASWEDLCAGRQFSVIELNGAGSEPAHIYDPKHSIFFAWKEIIRHLRLLYRVSVMNRRMKKVSYLSFEEGWKMFRDNSAYVKKIS